MIQRTTSYNLDVQVQLWQGYGNLVPDGFRYEERIQADMAVTVLENPDEVPEDAVEAAEEIVDQYADPFGIDQEVNDGP